ncbi:MAG: hypothetical protein ABIN37_08540 [Burkholderiaceae bacterium]
MKQYPLAVMALALVAICTHAQGQIYRCGNEYTNAVKDANKAHCKLVEGGNVTVVQGFKSPSAAAAGQPVRVAAANSTSATRTDSAEQRGRDSDARLILESELKKAESRQSDLLREYNAGEPDKRGDEARNYQKYLDRVADIKASIARNEGDIAGIRRELSRVPVAK